MASVQHRWCMICNTHLVTCKSYIKLGSARAIRTELAAALRHIVGDAIENNPSDYLCQKCELKTKKVCGLEHLQLEMKTLYNETISTHSTATSTSSVFTETSSKSTPVKKRQKRPAAFSPGTPKSKPQPKRATQVLHLQDKENSSSRTLSAGSRYSPSSRTITESDQIQALTGRCHQVKARASLSFKQPNPDLQPRLEISVNSGQTLETRTVSSEWNSTAKAIYKGDDEAAINHVLQMQAAKEKMHKLMLSEVKRETERLCKPDANSSFRNSSIKGLQEFSLKKQKEELEEEAPVLMSMLEAASTSDWMDKNVTKTKESVLPNIMMAAGIVLNCKSQRMNTHQCVNSLILKNSGIKRNTLTHLNAKGLAVSYATTLEKQTECCKDFDAEVKEWAKSVHDSNETERKLITEGDLDGLEAHNTTRTDQSYQLAMDNVDVIVHARHPTKNNYGKDFHMAHIIAVQNRVSAHHLPNHHTIPELQDIHNDIFLPSAEDNKMLRHEWAVLCSRVIADHFPALKSDLQGLPRQIPHDHMNEAKKKSKVVNLGVLMENENTSEGIYNIMHHMHQYVPGHNTDDPTTIISAGDLLTCERESNCLEEQRNSSTPSKRLEGLMPAIADFHALANYFQIVWKHLYDPASSGDKGTLYAARNYLNARNVTADPINNVNAAEHLLTQFTIALILAAAFKFFGMDDFDSEPSKNKFNLDLHGDIQTYASTIMHQFVDEIALPSNVELSCDTAGFICHLCQKKYVSKKNLKRHQKMKHPGDELCPPSESLEGIRSDGVQNYSRVALGMGLLALDFIDARKHGDGARIIRLYKFMLLHCKAAKKPKYSFHILRTLAQVKVFLPPRLSHELVWNRFVNTSGKEDGNSEVDRVVEHHNRVFKGGCCGLRGNLTQKNVDRISRSVQAIDGLRHHVEEEMKVKSRKSSKHKVLQKDAASLAYELHKLDIFGCQPGRAHHRFPQFPVSVLSTLDAAELHDWMKSSVKKLYRQHQFVKH